MKRKKYRYLALGGMALVLLLAGAPPVVARECLDCHAEVREQMGGSSHHVQGVGLTARHCYACHWEATAQGEVEPRYHDAHSAGSTDAGGAAAVDLVVWGADGQRPTVYDPARTAVRFQSAAIATERERGMIAGISRHCLSCHSDQNNDLRPFAGDGHTPRQYAWDGQSIAARYSQRGVTSWGKYSTVASNKKQRVTKAFSAHGNVAANGGGWTAAAGYDGDMPDTRGGPGAHNVECFDCHTAHGSLLRGITTSYATFDGSRNGGMLKETRAGRGGYRVSYTPSANSKRGSKNPYNAGAGLCFDCHESAAAIATPWGYAATYGARQPIMGYKDTARFGVGSKGSASRFANRRGGEGIASSHLQGGRSLDRPAVVQINGLCTPCHDPHGVSRTLGDRMPYGVPLLKGAWLTSPYREDGPPARTAVSKDGIRPRQVPVEGGNMAASEFVVSGSSGAPREPMQGMRYNVDRTTFGDGRRITENDTTFGGLCLQCHSRDGLQGAAPAGQVHRAVKGWGNNKEHAFPCAKCHQAHNSGLPRLMQTNCFEQGPAGLRENSGLPWTPARSSGNAAVSQASQPQTTATKKQKTNLQVVGCHVRQFGRSSAKGGDAQWQEKTPW
jgi:hypothetical protein